MTRAPFEWGAQPSSSRRARRIASLLRSALVLAAVVSLPACRRGILPRLDRGEDATEHPVVRLREIVLEHGVTESDSGELFAPASPNLRQALRELRTVADDRSIGGIFLRLGPLSTAARAEEIGASLERVRRAHKPVHCHFETADNVAYELLSSHCDRITMTPAGSLALVGVAAQAIYLRTVLANVGVTAQLLQIGRFKGAADPVTRDDMPEEVRTSLGRILDLRQARLLAAIVAQTGGTTADAQRLVDEGPFDADDARARHLVDALEYDDEARERARVAAHAERVDATSLKDDDAPTSIRDILRLLTAEPSETLLEEPYVALVRVEGTIVDGDRSRPGRTTSGPFVAELRRLARDRSCRAIVLRIDSPGGSALASDRMWHAVRRALGQRKPVIASVGDMAASGGYYVASAATEVFADETSLVGSIGVVGGKIEFSGLLERVGANSVVLARGRHAGIFLPFRPFDDGERAAVHGMLERTYERFLARVGEGRGLTRERLAPAAEGRLMLGPDARALGLVTTEGGLEDALVRARSLASLSSSAEVVEWPKKRPFLDALVGVFGGQETIAPVLGRAFAPELGTLADTMELFRGPERTHVVLPMHLDVR